MNKVLSFGALISLVYAARAARFRAAFGRLGRNELFAADSVRPATMAVLPAPSVARCALLCLDLDRPNWLCNLRANSSTNLVVCEAFALNKSVVFDTDIISYPGSTVIYDSRIARVGLLMAATCYNTLSAWVDNVMVISQFTNNQSTNPPIARTVDIPPTTKVVAFECTNDQGSGGVLAGFSTGLLTDNTWKCAYPDRGDTVTGWKDPGFNDSTWAISTSLQNTGSDTWLEVTDVSRDAYWIWGDGPFWVIPTAETRRAYCRKEDADHCVSSPCQNGSTCQHVFGGYVCLCDVGYSGVNCELG